MEFWFRPLEEEDKEFLRKLFERCYGQFEDLGSDFLRAFEKNWDPEKFQVICTEEGDVGALSVWEEKGYLWLSEILVDPQFQNRGLGTKVVTNVLDEARSKDLNVRLQDIAQEQSNTFLSPVGV